MPRYDDVDVGTALPAREFPITRATLVRYAGASGVVPDDDAGATVVVEGTVEEKLDDQRVVAALTARVGEGDVLSGARAVVRLA